MAVQLGIDLNCDMGESFGNYTVGNDEALLDYVSSANIACGFHAGDPAVMERTVQLAIKKQVAIGAHPGLPDLQGFGRREMAVSANECYQFVLYQLGALAAFVKAAGAVLHHVKPHGALYNMAATNMQLADPIAKAIHDFDASLILYGLANSRLIDAAKKYGLRSAAEAFADRTYTTEGLLTPRSRPQSMIEDEHASLQQVLSIVQNRAVTATDGSLVKLEADTICIHGDGKHAAGFAKLIRTQLEAADILIKFP
jgi:UPF0271 protein